MTKNGLVLITMLLLGWLLPSLAQSSFSSILSQEGKDILVLHINGKTEEGWHISQGSITIEECEGAALEGGRKEPASNDFAYGDQCNSVSLAERLKVTAPTYHIRGYYQYIVCSDMSCLAPKYVEFDYRGKGIAEETSTEERIVEAKEENVVSDTLSGAATGVKVVGENNGFNPADNPLWAQVIDELKSLDDKTSDTESGDLLSLCLLAFAGGLLALFTPCVWPVIPLTVSFFMKRGKGVRDAVLYGVCIIVIFLLLGIVVTSLFGADALNGLATNAAFNIVCFVVLVLLGLSFVGLYTLQLPASWGNRLDTAVERTSGIISIFLMALTLVVVSFSCTAPVVGMLLVEVATRGEVLAPLVGMLSFALALALPFTLFALFPGIMKRMPRSGEWMQHVKVTLGVLEVAFALKFLSVADLAYGWHILSRDTFLIVWIVVFASLGIYYLVNVGRRRMLHILLSLVPFAFVAYLVTGLFGAPCTMVSAFLPPMEIVEHTVYTDYEKGMAEARRQGKPVFLEFTGYGCVNCRKMEGAVFADARVTSALRSDFVCIRLYVDDRTPLSQKPFRTVGDKWSLLERYKFGEQSQPLYLILSADGIPQKKAYHYDEDVQRFLQWLEL